MWKKEITIEIQASKEEIWKIWSDVKNWNKWDSEVQWSILEGKFEMGTKGILKPTKGPKTKFIILTANYPIEFTSRSYLPFSKMDFTHKLAEVNGKLLITHGVEISGITTFIFSKIIGNKIVSELPKAMKNLSSLVQNTKT